MNDLPPNYSGQYRKDSPEENDNTAETDESSKYPESLHNTRSQAPNQRGIPEKQEKEPEESKELKEKKNSSLFGNLFGGNKEKDGKKGGLLSGLFGKGDGDKDKDGGFLSRIELEDLILIAVIFFLLKDGFEDDLILILAIILFSA